MSTTYQVMRAMCSGAAPPRPAPRRCSRAPAAPARRNRGSRIRCCRVPADLAADEHDAPLRGDAVGVALRRGAQPARLQRSRMPMRRFAPFPGDRLGRLGAHRRAPWRSVPSAAAGSAAACRSRCAAARRRTRSRAGTCTARSSRLTKSCSAVVIAGAGLVSGLQHDERLDDLPALLVRRADHAALGHRGMQQQRAFDLRARRCCSRR